VNWREIDWNIATLGRLFGITIIIAGIVLSALDASAFTLSPSSGADSYFRFRFFLAYSIGFAWKGGLVFAGAELADRFGWGGRTRLDWHGPRLLRLLGLAVTAVGIGVSVWNVAALSDIGASLVIRVITHGVIGSLWQGGMLVLAAELADRIGWPGGDTQETVAELPA
jgi:hypothetical protein